MAKRDWLALGDALGPQPAAYHPDRYRFPDPHPPEKPGVIEYSDGSVLRLADIGRVVVCGDPEWRTRRYVTQEVGG